MTPIISQKRLRPIQTRIISRFQKYPTQRIIQIHRHRSQITFRLHTPHHHHQQLFIRIIKLLNRRFNRL
uniref:Uncharacterized protein n=1 Tax=Helianthus annuus TaxID=4232 RepID=A0A251SLL7_HELAN